MKNENDKGHKNSKTNMALSLKRRYRYNLMNSSIYVKRQLRYTHTLISNTIIMIIIRNNNNKNETTSIE